MSWDKGWEEIESETPYRTDRLYLSSDAYGVKLSRLVNPDDSITIDYDEIPDLIEQLREVNNARNASGPEKL